MFRPLLVFLVSLLLPTSIWACSCNTQILTFCNYYQYCDQVVYGRVDSMRSDSTGAYITVFETFKGSIQANTQIVVEDDSATTSGSYGSCFDWVSGKLVVGDTFLLPMTDTVYRFDTISQQWVYMFNVGFCTNNLGLLNVSNGRVLDSGILRTHQFTETVYSIDTTYAAYHDMLLTGGCVGYDTIVSVEDIEPIDQQRISYSKGVFSVDDVSDQGMFNCYNLAGQRVLTNSGNTLEAAELRSGIYIVEYLNNGKAIREKFFIP